MVRWSAVVVALLASSCVAAGITDSAEPLNKAVDNDDYLVKQVIWRKCHRKLTPACLKLSLVRTVEMMSKDSSYFLAPGVSFSSNSTDSAPMPAELARSLSQEQHTQHLDDLVSFAVSRFMRSVTLNVNLVDFLSGGNETIQNSVVDAFSGRGKGNGGFGGYGGLALVMGGSLASMMLAGLAALSGKALMTSMLALMMSAMAAMKGSGGGGGGEHKTYEVITKPIVSHINTHSSEVQHEHGHHHYRRSLERGVVTKQAEVEPYMVYAPEVHRSLIRSSSLGADAKDVTYGPHRVFGEQDWKALSGPNLKAISEEMISESSNVKKDEEHRNKRSVAKNKVGVTPKDIVKINKAFPRYPQRNIRNVGENDDDQEKDSSESPYTYSKIHEKDKDNVNSMTDQGLSESRVEVTHRKKRGLDQSIENTGLNTEGNIYNSHKMEQEGLRRRNLVLAVENPTKLSYGIKTYLPVQELLKDKRDVDDYNRNVEGLAEGNLNQYNPPFKYIPTPQSARIKRMVDGSDLSNSRILHIYQSPYEYASTNHPLIDAIDSRRYKRRSESRLTMPLTLVN